MRKIFINIVLMLLASFALSQAQEKNNHLTIKVGDPAEKAHELLCTRFGKIASGGFFSTSKNNREVSSNNSGYCKQYRITKGNRSLIFVTAQKDGKITALASVYDKLPLEFDAIPWMDSTEAKIEFGELRVIWNAPKK